MSGFFISFEGTEGCGKSTQIERLARHLEATGKTVLQTREPGGTPLGESIRKLLQHDEAGEGMTPESELLLFAASRAQLTRERIAPALAAGQIVLCDRFMDSTTVYQGVARKLPPEAVASVNAFAVGTTRPHLTLLIDIPAAAGLERVRGRTNGEFDRMEREAVEFFEAVRRGYLKLAAAEPERFVVLDGTQSVETLENHIRDEVDRRLA